LPGGLVQGLKAVSSSDSEIKFRLVNTPEANVSLLATITVTRSPATNRLRTPAVVANVRTLRKG